MNDMVKLTSAEKSEVILHEIVKIINTGHMFSLQQDFGDNTATIYIGGSHTHVGIPPHGNDDFWDVFVNNLYDQLTGGAGLSWAGECPRAGGEQHDLKAQSVRMSLRLDDAYGLLFSAKTSAERAKPPYKGFVADADRWLNGEVEVTTT